MTFHGSIEHQPESSRAVPGGHEHNGLYLMLVAPWQKHLAFVLNVVSWNLNDIRDAKRSQLMNLFCGFILVRKPPADELMVFSIMWRVCKNRNSRRNAAPH
jgi:hypothetical protein